MLAAAAAAVCVFQYMELLVYDPHQNVRQSVLNRINISKATTKVILQKSMRDSSTAVRKLAITVIATRVAQVTMTIRQRVKAMAEALRDREEAVRHKGVMLVATWMEEKGEQSSVAVVGCVLLL